MNRLDRLAGPCHRPLPTAATGLCRTAAIVAAMNRRTALLAKAARALELGSPTVAEYYRHMANTVAAGKAQ